MRLMNAIQFHRSNKILARHSTRGFILAVIRVKLQGKSSEPWKLLVCFVSISFLVVTLFLSFLLFSSYTSLYMEINMVC